ncbi:rhomboid family intramembrane serine protease [Amycolatopsis sp. NPDC059657]|uniref:rhomboid family intramembrane serine protease n=1 Tax=Amycolatopsis sp. NPDC059657 TaxID=3346899 RepID=UPI003672B2A5
MSQPPYPQIPESAALPGCWWHPKRQTGLSCVRCGRPACPDCLREAAVGFQCVDCVQSGQRVDKDQRKQYEAAGYGQRTVTGARMPRRIVVTPVLIALNVLVFLLTVVQSGSMTNNNGGSKIGTGGWLDSVLVAHEGEYWRLFTSGFLHDGLLHIAVNMLSLWMLGRDLERAMGPVRYTVAYLVSLFGGSVAVVLFAPDRPVVGASGAIYGLLGAILIALLRLKLNPTSALVIIGVNLVLSVSIPGISLFAHLGGLVAGAIVMAAMVYAPEKSRAAWQAGMTVLVTVALIGLFAIGNARLGDQTCGVAPTGDHYVCSASS